jgi:hypothetical protein
VPQPDTTYGVLQASRVIDCQKHYLNICRTRNCARLSWSRRYAPRVISPRRWANRWLTDADVAAVIKLVGVQVPPLDKTLGQHQGWSREFSVWNWQTFRRCHCRISIARWSSARQANRRFVSNPKCEYNLQHRLSSTPDHVVAARHMNPYTLGGRRQTGNSAKTCRRLIKKLVTIRWRV